MDGEGGSSVASRMSPKPLLMAFDAVRDSVAIIQKPDLSSHTIRSMPIRPQSRHVTKSGDFRYCLQIISQRLPFAEKELDYMPGGLAFDETTGNVLVSKREDECETVYATVRTGGAANHVQNKCFFNIDNSYESAVSVHRVAYKGPVQPSMMMRVCLAGKVEDDDNWKGDKLNWKEFHLTPICFDDVIMKEGVTWYALAEPFLIQGGRSVGVCLFEVFVYNTYDASAVQFKQTPAGPFSRFNEKKADMDTVSRLTVSKADSKVPFYGLPVAAITYNTNPLGKHMFVYKCDGSLLTSFANYGSGERRGELCNPTSVTVDKHGTIIVSDTGNHRLQIYRRDSCFITRSLSCP
jgi:hypothetical protein